MKKVLIIGCGLLGSSLVRTIAKKKNCKKNIYILEIKIKYYQNKKIEITG